MDPESKDPLDEPSDCYVEHTDGSGVTVKVELTFRQLAAVCAEDMVLWDTMTQRSHEANQRANDPNYKPLQPGAGLRKYRRWRG